MKYVTLLLAILLAGLVYYRPPNLPSEAPERLVISSNTPLEQMDKCLRLHIHNVIESWERTSTCKYWSGRSGCKPAVIYSSRDAKFRLILQRHLMSNDLKVRSVQPLTPDEISLFRACASGPIV
jgi:hypothetical protein